ncbi:MAG: hypothetical protein JNK41_02265 [Saprospiraceae bacterium]|nr:hypothetical protein [Saprospiraceae bacterium]
MKSILCTILKNIIIYIILRILLEYLLEGNVMEDVFFRAFTEGLVLALIGLFLFRSQIFKNLTIGLADQFRKFF